VTDSANFATTAGAFQRSLAGGYDAFVVKLDPARAAQLYSTYAGGSTSQYDPPDDNANAIKGGCAGTGLLGGLTYSDNLPDHARRVSAKRSGPRRFIPHEAEG